MAPSGRPPAHWVTIRPGFFDGTRGYKAKCRCGHYIEVVREKAAQEWANTHEDANYKKGMDYYVHRGTRY